MAVKAACFDFGGTLMQYDAWNNLYKPIPGAEKMIDYIRERKQQGPFYTAIITNGEAGQAAQLLKEFGWEDAFDTIAEATDTIRKPNPQMLDMALKGHPDRSKLLKSEIVHIGDTQEDRDFAKAAHIQFLGLQRDNYQPPLDPAQAFDNIAQAAERLAIMARSSGIERG